MSVLQNNCSTICAGDETEFCGGNSLLSVWSLPGYVAPNVTSGSSSSTGTGAPQLATNIAYLGCYNEVGSPRALTTVFSQSPGMTIDQCAQAAQAQNLAYFGLEFASQCLAGSVLNANSKPIAASTCSMQCAGNTTEVCGGQNAISLYNNTQYVTPYNPNPVNVPGHAGTQYNYVGCYSEPPNNRALGQNGVFGSLMTTNASLTVEGCAAYCFTNGYTYMGVEDQIQCFCNGAGPINGATISAGGDADCNIVCPGNPQENCGGAGKLNVYKLKSNSKRRVTW